MDKTVIGLVLIPPTEILDLCTKINERAFDKGTGLYIGDV